MTPDHKAYELVAEQDLPEYRSRAFFLRHTLSRCELLCLVNDDPECAFAYAFKTPPLDSRGIPHILEHVALCGSRRFPDGDAFLELAKGSLATYLNAYTSVDATVYPAASAVPADFDILLDVYGDAVFDPLLDEGSFLSEGIHYKREGDAIRAGGVVYNEMKGAYSSGDSLLADKLMSSLYSKGHPYTFDSGGNPEYIVKTAHEDLVAFHRRYYHPGNCRIYLYGSLDFQKTLDVLDRRFLTPYARDAESAPEVPLQERFAEPIRDAIEFQASEGSDARPQAVCSWLTARVTEPDEVFDLEILARILIGSDGAPLTTALLESRLGDDLSPHCGISTYQREAAFTAGLRGADDAEAVERVLLSALAGLSERGYDPELIASAFHSVALSQRELHHGGGSYGLRPFGRALRGWLHGAGPFATLSFVAPYEKALARLRDEPGRYARLTREWFVDNAHRAAIVSRPAALERPDESFPGESVRAKHDAAVLDAWRSNPKKPGSIPRLAIEDLPRDPIVVPREFGNLDSRPAAYNPLFTNGIGYFDALFPIPFAPALPELPWYPLLTRCSPNSGTERLGFDAMARELARWTGGVSLSIITGTAMDGKPRAWLLYRTKFLEEDTERAVPLFLELVHAPRLSDTARIRDLYSELRNDMVSGLVPAGNAFAQFRSACPHTQACALDELWGGIAQAGFLRDAGTADPELMSNLLVAMHRRIVHPARAYYHVCASAAGTAKVARAVEKASPSGSFRRGEPASRPAESGANAFLDASARTETMPGVPLAVPRFGEDRPERALPSSCAASERFLVDSDVGYTSVSCRSDTIASRDYGTASVLAHYLSTGPLWEKVRSRGGAYGVSCSFDPLEGIVCLSSYRDPEPENSLSILERAFSPDDPLPGEDDCRAAINGSVGRDVRPPSPEDSGAVDLRRLLFGVTDEMRALKREGQLASTPRELARVAAAMHERMRAGHSTVLISGPHDVQSSSGRRFDSCFDIR